MILFKEYKEFCNAGEDVDEEQLIKMIQEEINTPMENNQLLENWFTMNRLSESFEIKESSSFQMKMKLQQEQLSYPHMEHRTG